MYAIRSYYEQFLLILAFVTLLHSAIAADNTNGRIVVYFATKVNIVAKPYEIMANDSLVARIRNNSFAEYTCKPGSYNIRITNAPTANTSINVVAGKSYFVQIMTMPGFWKPQPIFRITSYNVCYTKLLRFAPFML